MMLPKTALKSAKEILRTHISHPFKSFVQPPLLWRDVFMFKQPSLSVNEINASDQCVCVGGGGSRRAVIRKQQSNKLMQSILNDFMQFNLDYSWDSETWSLSQKQMQFRRCSHLFWFDTIMTSFDTFPLKRAHFKATALDKTFLMLSRATFYGEWDVAKLNK